MHFPVGFKNIDDNPFPVDKEKKRAVFDEIDYVITYNEMEKLVGDHCKGIFIDLKALYLVLTMMLTFLL